LVAGYNWQSGRFVYGVEGDVSGSSSSKTTFEGSSFDGLYTRLGAVATLRGRLGYSVTDPLLVYVTAGVAGGYFNSVGGEQGDSPGWEDDESVLSLGKWKLGWTVGAGAEMKLGNNWSARLEYLYADFGNNKGVMNDDDDNARFNDKAHIARVGLIYRFGGSGAASAARASVAAQPWTGFYAGVVGGYVQTDSRIEDNYAGGGLNEFDGDWFGHRPAGFIGGLAAGYNWQSGRFVYGVEGDVSGSTLSKTSFEGTSEDGLYTRLGAVSTLRGRLGYNVTNPLLVYATAGVAGGYFNSVGGEQGASPAWEDDESSLSLGKWKLGWTVGAGAEMKLSNNWSARVEYLYADFGNNKGVRNDDDDNARFNDKAHIARVGLIYRFGSTGR
jgi:outer membrane immunogenic protein